VKKQLRSLPLEEAAQQEFLAGVIQAFQSARLSKT
jgi:hypothetical protein